MEIFFDLGMWVSRSVLGLIVSTFLVVILTLVLNKLLKGWHIEKIAIGLAVIIPTAVMFHLF